MYVQQRFKSLRKGKGRFLLADRKSHGRFRAYNDTQAQKRTHRAGQADIQTYHQRAFGSERIQKQLISQR